MSLGMPFFRRFPNGSSPDSGSNPSLVVDSNLTQADDYWNNTWLYFAGSSGSNAGQVRLITDFSSGSDGLIPEFPLPGSPATSENYEIHNLFNAFEIHDAINSAIHHGFPHFYDTRIDESLVLEEDIVTYDLSSITPRPWMITKLWLEWSDEAFDYVPASSATTSVTMAANVSTNIIAGWKISVYDGTGSGQLRTVSSVSSATINITEAWETNPDTTSKIKVWNPNTYVPWWELRAASFDSPEYPTKIYLTRRYADRYGFRIRIQYATLPLDLDADSDETVVPSEYIVPKAKSYLYSSRIVDNRVERNKYAQGIQDAEQKAIDYKTNNAFSSPSITLWSDEDNSDGIYPTDNPMGWARE